MAECTCGMPLAMREPYCPRCGLTNSRAVEDQLFELDANGPDQERNPELVQLGRQAAAPRAEPAPGGPSAPAPRPPMDPSTK